MSPILAISRVPLSRARVRLWTILLFSLAFFFAGQCYAQEQNSSENQNAAEAARQEQARKAAKEKKARHVYTEEDLKRAKILTPEDQERAQAKKPAPILPGDNKNEPAENVEAQSGASTEPLGDVARRYRKLKEAERAAEQALKNSPSRPSSKFKLGLPTTSLAAPAMPLVPNSSGQPIRSDAQPSRVAPGAPKFSGALPGPSPVNPRRTFAPKRISPFQPRPLVVAPKTPSLFVAPSNVPSRPAEIPKTEAPKSFSAAPSVPRAPHSSAMISAKPPVVRRGTPAAPVTPSVTHSAPAVPTIASAPIHNVTVQRGDSLWKIAQQYMGRGSAWPQLVAANPRLVDPNRLATGSHLVVPDSSSLVRKSSSADKNAAGMITVQKGDSLWKIAASHLGSGAAWTCLAGANPSLHNPDLILEGQTLNLPTTCKP